MERRSGIGAPGTAVKPEDIDKPKNQTYQVFIDTPVELPA